MFTGAVNTSTIQGNSGNDTFQFVANVNKSSVLGGSGVDDINGLGLSGSQVYGNVGDDSITFTGHVTSSTILGGGGSTDSGADSIVVGGSLISSSVAGANPDTFSSPMYLLPPSMAVPVTTPSASAALTGSSMIAGTGNDLVSIIGATSTASVLIRAAATHLCCTTVLLLVSSWALARAQLQSRIRQQSQVHNLGFD